MRPLPCVAVMSVLGLLFGCGNSGLPPQSDITVTVTPAIATIGPSGTLDLHGSVTGLSNPTMDWWMQDQHDAHPVDGSENCDLITDANTELIPACQFGYLTGEGTVQASASTVTYHAPATPGTYHVTLRVFQMGNTWSSGGVEKRATATITVKTESGF